MAIQDLASKCFVGVLIKRSDGERFLLGDGDYMFSQDQLHFEPDEIISDVVDVHGGDGALLAGQVRRAVPQEFNGYIGDAGYSKAKTETPLPSSAEKTLTKPVTFSSARAQRPPSRPSPASGKRSAPPSSPTGKSLNWKPRRKAWW